MKFTVNELLKKSGVPFEKLPKEKQNNLLNFLDKLNKLGTYYTKPVTVSSFYRTPEYQINVYKKIAMQHKHPFKDGVFRIEKVPMGSAHIQCRAIDINDPTGELDAWLQGPGLPHLEALGLYVEHPNYTKGWAHIQDIKPKSGKRFFIP